ncbi:glycosyltransferase [Epilithonimonas hungarica]|uniref:Glycosyltransferase involved in cell wall bisynthesis n=1 Tax=Epilithonimonas hungarica TaxID=454006 RepID=A0A1G7GHW5_9FLAO|nr:glycosyltransferase [Epilithonimonas hungarica]SDE87609.1 Glycosyltransferase involved in cell wall bisynthesis [Epilithonimonas hungarica]
MKGHRLRILLIMPYGSVGGMERLAETFYKNYKKQGHEVKAVKIIRLENDIINFDDDEISLSRKDFSDFSSVSRIAFYAKIPIMLSKIIKVHKIDISISFGDMANCFSAMTLTKEKKIASFHAVKSIEFKHDTGISKFFKWSIHNTYKRFDKVIAISQAIKNDLIINCGYKFKNLEVIYNPHDVSAIESKSKEPFAEDEKKIVENSYIVFLGRLSVQKAPWHLIKAFSLMKDQFAETNLLMIGDGDERVEMFTKNLVDYLKLNDRVFFLGRKRNPYKFLQKSKGLALSSYYEGTPNVIVEAMILNIPVITTNCTDGISEMMIDKINGVKDGLLITDVGIITPDILKNREDFIPENFEINDDDVKYAEALSLLLNEDMNNSFRSVDKSGLLKKYNLENVLKDYLA